VALKSVTPPAKEPVSLAEVKLHLRVDDDADDTLIGALVTAAREVVEAISGRALVTQTLEMVQDGWPIIRYIRIPRPPLQSVVSIKYTDSSGTEHTLDEAVYFVDAESEPGRIALRSGQSWPATALQELNAVRIRYTAGYGDAEDVPARFKQAILLLVGHWYENREDAQPNAATMAEIPHGVNALLWLDRQKVF
jgi:uncharacterized phiE125 gp8 family phage protein